MLGIPFFKQRKPRKFNYTPIHYDPVAEAREKRRKELLGDDAEVPAGNGGGEYQPGDFIRSRGLRSRNMPEMPDKAKSTRKIIRGVATIVILILLIIWALS